MFDLVPQTLAELQAIQVVAGIGIRPGHTTSISLLDETIIINLPGNPGAVNLLFEVIVRPLLNKLQGSREFNNSWFAVPILQGLPTPAKQRLLCKGYLVSQSGRIGAVIHPAETAKASINRLIIDLKEGEGLAGEIVKAIMV